MGFEVKVDEDKGEVVVTLGEKVVSVFRPENMKNRLRSQLEYSGGDYIK